MKTPRPEPKNVTTLAPADVFSTSTPPKPSTLVFSKPAKDVVTELKVIATYLFMDGRDREAGIIRDAVRRLTISNDD